MDIIVEYHPIYFPSLDLFISILRSYLVSIAEITVIRSYITITDPTLYVCMYIYFFLARDHKNIRTSNSLIFLSLQCIHYMWGYILRMHTWAHAHKHA